MTFLTLSFIYRPMYYSLIANYSKLKVIALVVSIIILSFPLMIRNSAKVLKIQGTLGESWAFYETAAPWDLSNTRILSDFKYLDKYDEGGRISYFVLETYYSDRDVLNIYFSFKYVNPLFENDNSSKLSEDQFQELIDEQIHVVIDNKPITGKWKFHYLKNTKQHVLVKELETYSLTKGRHNVKVEMPDLDRPDNKGVIEFWKD